MSTCVSGFAPRPEPPYYAVIFTSQRTDGDEGYATTAARMVELAAAQPGYLGVESARGADGLGITVSYWLTLDDIAAWRRHLEHTAARNEGRSRWYSHYELRVARVERAYGWDQADGVAPASAAVLDR
jgi:heme-degrading monooxygenase HmoA